jgi:hypothetical protein
MILHEPLKISARLLPAIQVAGAWISFERETNNFYFDLPDGQSFIVDDYRPGCFSVSNKELFVLQCFDDLFSFISVQIEAYDYFVSTREHGENHNLFDQALAIWMYKNRYALEDTQCEVMDRLEE